MRRGPTGREGIAETPVEPALRGACYRQRRVPDERLAGLRHRHLSHDALSLTRSVVELEALGLEAGRKHPGEADGLQRIAAAASCRASLAPARQFAECRIQRSPIADDVSTSIVLKADECLSRLGDGGVHQKGSPVSGRDQAQSPRFIISRRRASWKRLVRF